MLFFYFAFVVALAGRAMAFTELVVDPKTDLNFTVSEFLDVPAGPVKDSCASTCGLANTRIQECNGDTPCQCRVEVTGPFGDCQQCYFTELIKRNQAAPDPFMGSTPLLQAYIAACVAQNETFDNPMALAPPLPFWNGPVGIDLGLPLTIFGVITVAWMGVSAIWLLSNM